MDPHTAAANGGLSYPRPCLLHLPSRIFCDEDFFPPLGLQIWRRGTQTDVAPTWRPAARMSLTNSTALREPQWRTNRPGKTGFAYT